MPRGSNMGRGAGAFVWGTLIGLVGWTALQAAAPTPQVLVSQSGQFRVSRPFTARLPADLEMVSTNAAFLRVDPALLVVTCERTRQRLAQELAGLPPGRDRILIAVIPAKTPTDALTLMAERQPGGWTYRMAVPEVVQRQRLLEGLVGVILLEVANQSAGEMSTDLPAWLVAGWAGRLRALAGEELLFTPPRAGGPVAVQRTVVERRQYDPLQEVRPVLEREGALTWQQLCWPGGSDSPGPESESFRASAQLLVHELLRLPSGRAAMVAFITGRSRYLNWQTAFLAAYSNAFARLLDVEKWWAVQVACFQRAPSSPAIAPPGESAWRSLQGALKIPVEVRSSPDELPMAQTNWSLQAVIRHWDWSRQQAALQACMARLQALSPTLPWEARTMAWAYMQALGRYMDLRPRTEPSVPAAGLLRPTLPRLVYETLEQLDRLDAELQANLARTQPRPVSPGESRAGSVGIVTNDLGTVPVPAVNAPTARP